MPARSTLLISVAVHLLLFGLFFISPFTHNTLPPPSPVFSVALIEMPKQQAPAPSAAEPKPTPPAPKPEVKPPPEPKPEPPAPKEPPHPKEPPPPAPKPTEPPPVVKKETPPPPKPPEPKPPEPKPPEPKPPEPKKPEPKPPEPKKPEPKPVEPPKPPEKPVEKKPPEKPVEKKPPEKPTEKKPPEKPSEKPPEKPTEKKPSEKPAEKPAEKKPPEKPAEKEPEETPLDFSKEIAKYQKAAAAKSTPKAAEAPQAVGEPTQQPAAAPAGPVVSQFAIARWQRGVTTKVRDNWRKPGGLRGEAALEVIVIVKVGPDGSLLQPKVSQSSGNAVYDESVMRAIIKTVSVDPPPQGCDECRELEIRFRPEID